MSILAGLRLIECTLILNSLRKILFDRKIIRFGLIFNFIIMVNLYYIDGTLNRSRKYCSTVQTNCINRKSCFYQAIIVTRGHGHFRILVWHVAGVETRGKGHGLVDGDRSAVSDNKLELRGDEAGSSLQSYHEVVRGPDGLVRPQVQGHLRAFGSGALPPDPAFVEIVKAGTEAGSKPKGSKGFEGA